MRARIIAAVLTLAVLMCAPASFAATNPSVTIVNPVSGSVLYADSLLVSVKLTTPASISVAVTQEFKVEGGENTAVTLESYLKTDKSEIASVGVGEAESFTSTGNLSFYTKKIENLKPGVYKITVDTIGADGSALYTNSSPVEIKPKEENPVEPADAESRPSGPAQFLKNLLKIIFKE